VAIEVSGVIEPTLQTAESLRLGDRAVTNLSAYELYLRALPDFHSYERERIFRALEVLNAAIAELSPNFGDGLKDQAAAAWA
jgi:adenylate cyclase